MSPNNENWCRQIKMHSQYLDEIWSELFTGFDLKQHSQYYFFFFICIGLGIPSISQHDQEVAKKFGLNFNEVFDSEGLLINSEQVCFIMRWNTYMYMICI